ncbi:MazG nucleotide pyrophosphohydrolase domain-containing protein, partial [bacterium]
DLLLQVIFHAQIAEEQGRFNIYDVIDTLAKKLKRRHPHVFGDKKASTPEEIIKIWKEIKKQEKKDKNLQ